jgi:aryl-alcohol dehydrogenase-like predicted oxidoreductase
MSPASNGLNPLRQIEFGLGTWQWGDRFMWNYGQGYGAADWRAAFDASLAAGVTLFDTAEVYGMGRSEKYLGQFLRTAKTTAPVVATKFFPFPWRLGQRALARALRGSLRRLGLPAVDIYQIHWPFPPVAIETWMEALADAVDARLIRAAGISNYNSAQTRQAYAALTQRGVRLASNQVPFSLLDRRIEHNGLLALCQELDIRVIAYSPLAQGLLGGTYTAENPPPGLRGWRYAQVLRRLEPLVQALREAGEAHGGKTPAQVALNWCLCKGTLPIPGAKNAQQAEQNSGALGWRLTRTEVARLDQLSDQVTHTPSGIPARA